MLPYQAACQTSKIGVFCGHECDMRLADFLRHYGYLLAQPNGYLWLVGGGITKTKACEIAARYRQIVEQRADTSTKVRMIQ